MTIEEVKQIIANSKYDEGLKNRLVLLLPRLEKYTLSGLGKEVSRGDSVIISDYLTSLWEKFANFLYGIKNKDEGSFKNLLEFLEENLNKFNGEDELYILNFVADLRPLVSNEKARISTEQYQKLIDFEIALFWELPEEEVTFFLQNQLLFLELKVNLLEYVKVATWENEWDYKNNFSKSFSDLLLQNKEKLGDKTVGSWVQNYFNFSSPSSFRADVVQVAEFLIKDPSVQKLSEQERKTLSEILKLYVWFLKPELNEDEILVYKEEIREKQMKKAEELILKEIASSSVDQNSKETILYPPIVPAPKDLPLKKPMEEVERISNNKAPRQQSPEAQALGGQGESANRKPNVMTQAGSKDRKMDLDDTDARPGLKMWNSTPPQMGQRIKNQESPVADRLKPDATGQARIKEDTNKKVVEISSAEIVVDNNTDGASAKIDKKLEELEKRIKN